MEQSHQRPEDTTDSDREEPPLAYSEVPRTEAENLADKRLAMAHDWLISVERPDDISDHKYTLIIRYAAGFFINSNVLWKRDPQGSHK